MFDFVTCMTTSLVPKSCMVCPMEGSTSYTVFYSVFKLVHNLSCKYCSCNKYFLCIYSDVARGPVSRVSGGIEHPKTQFDSYVPVQCDFKCYKLIYSLFKYVLLLFLLRDGLRSSGKSHRMTRTNKNSACVTNTSVYQENTNVSQGSSSSDQDKKCKAQVFNHLQVKHNLFKLCSYLEAPKMDWTVNDGLYHSFFKWRLKCENILDCELAMLHESKKCKKVIAWSGDCGMDQYVSWCLPIEDLCLDTICPDMKIFASHK